MYLRASCRAAVVLATFGQSPDMANTIRSYQTHCLLASVSKDTSLQNDGASICCGPQCRGYATLERQSVPRAEHSDEHPLASREYQPRRRQSACNGTIYSWSEDGGGNSGASVVILEMFERLFGTRILVPWEPCGLHVLYHGDFPADSNTTSGMLLRRMLLQMVWF